ncbi:MAG: hypothetical protein IT464_03175 [Planctomycetes bacterium]|nr:hypothetical protein [Planctomycetota bacterium]
MSPIQSRARKPCAAISITVPSRVAERHRSVFPE